MLHCGEQEGQRGTTSMEKDGKSGTDDPNNSMALLIRWLVHPGNLAKWLGGRYSGGKTKSNIAVEIAESINKQGVR